MRTFLSASLVICLLQGLATADDIDAIVSRAKASLEEADYDAAIDRLGPATKEHPKKAVLWRLLGEATLMQAEALASQGVSATFIVASYRDAAEYFQKAVDLEPKTGENLALLARAQFQGGQITEAAETAKKAVEIEPENVDHRLVLGGIQYQLYVENQDDSTRLDTARETYAQAVEIDPKNLSALNGLAYCWAIGGEQDKAVEIYEKSLRIEPSQPGVHTTLFQLLGNDQEDNSNPLIELYDRLIAAHPESAAVLYYRGYALLNNGQLSQAEFSLQSAIAKDESYAEWVKPQLAKVKLQQAQKTVDSNREKASELVLAAVKLAPDVEEVRSMVDFLGGRFVSDQELDAGREFFAEVTQLVEDNADWWNNLALLARDTEQYEQSYQAYRKALELKPDDPRLLNDCALIQHYHLKNDLAEAKKMYRRAIELAKEQLESPVLTTEVRQELEVALRDAENNLDRLENGRGRRGGRGRSGDR
ncbi:MAG: tetratricopeptide repeat protein [Planctomycetota bacterium]